MKRYFKQAVVALAFALALGVVSGVRPLQAQVPAQQSASEKSTPESAVPEKREQEKDANEQYRHSKAVVKMGSMIGLNADQAATAFTLLNFLVLAAGVGFLAVKILPKAFRDRTSVIQKGLVEARTVTEEASARLRAVESRLAKLDEEIAGMRQQVEADTVREEQRIKASMEAETAKILAAAETEIQAATVAARRDLQRHAAELAIAQAARQLDITAETDRLLVHGFAQKLVRDRGAQN